MQPVYLPGSTSTLAPLLSVHGLTEKDDRRSLESNPHVLKMFFCPSQPSIAIIAVDSLDFAHTIKYERQSETLLCGATFRWLQHPIAFQTPRLSLTDSTATINLPPFGFPRELETLPLLRSGIAAVLAEFGFVPRGSDPGSDSTPESASSPGLVFSGSSS